MPWKLHRDPMAQEWPVERDQVLQQLSQFGCIDAPSSMGASLRPLDHFHLGSANPIFQ